MTLAGRTAIITGGAQGIGAVYARAFAAEGANVVIADLLDEPGAALAHDLQGTGASALFVHTDVTSDASTEQLAARAAATFGGIDILVNNAALYMALGQKKPFETLTTEEWDRVLAVNVRGVWHCTKAVVPYMKQRGGGKIINIASVVAFSGTPGFAHYVASKAAVIGLTRALARELGDHRITVNAVAPGLVANEASRQLNAEPYLAQAVGARALKRPMEPDDLVGTVLYLASPASDFVTGQTIVVDGGAIMD